MTDLGLDRFDAAGRSRLATDPIALPFPVSAEDDDPPVGRGATDRGRSRRAVRRWRADASAEHARRVG